MHILTGKRLSPWCAVALLFTMAVDPAQGEDACELVPGTYVTTVSDIEGVFASRGVITFAVGGALLVNDSRRGGEPGVFEPFTAAQGSWMCAGGSIEAPKIRGVALSFVLPSPGLRYSFGRVDYEATFAPGAQTLTGTIELRIREDVDLEQADPIGRAGPVLETFAFEGRRLAVQ